MLLFKETIQQVPMSALVRSYKMNNVVFIEVETFTGVETHAIIDRGNGEFTSMPKSVYDTLASESQAPAAPTA